MVDKRGLRIDFSISEGPKCKMTATYQRTRRIAGLFVEILGELTGIMTTLDVPTYRNITISGLCQNKYGSQWRISQWMQNCDEELDKDARLEICFS
jgi:hypothetical protein